MVTAWAQRGRVPARGYNPVHLRAFASTLPPELLARVQGTGLRAALVTPLGSEELGCSIREVSSLSPQVSKHHLGDHPPGMLWKGQGLG